MIFAMKTVLTTFEAAFRYKLTTGYIRRIMAEGKVKGRFSRISRNKRMWLIDAVSLRHFMKNRPGPGRPRK